MSYPIEYGISGLTFGSPAVNGFVVQTFSNSSKAGVVAEVFDENGRRVHSRYDDVTNEMTFDAIIKGATLPTPGQIFTVNSVDYETLSVDAKYGNKEFTACSIKGKNSANLSV